MIVMKFGGTSVEDAIAIRRLLEIVGRERNRPPLVVVSACAGVTNELLRVAQSVRGGDKSKAQQTLKGIKTRHKQIASDLLAGELLNSISEKIDELIQELQNFVQGVYLLGELTPRSVDAFSSFGEQLSSLIIHAAMKQNGMDAELVDARSIMLTDNAFTSALPKMERVTEKAKEIILPHIASNKIVITQGFIGATEDGITTTIGRGGSDLSASIFGSVLDTEEIQIWTDVDGMMSADPRIIPEAHLIDVMSFAEASELAYFGAKVLHPRTILPAVEKKIPVRVLNSKRPEVRGTLIVHDVLKETTSNGDVIKSIAFKKGITVINVNSSRMLMAHGFLAKLFSIFEEFQKSVDVVATSEVSVSLTVDSEEQLTDILTELQKIGDVQIKQQKAIVCVVGEGMRNAKGTGARIFAALANADVNIEMVSEGASEINLTLVVDEQDVAKSVRALHDEFFAGKK